MVPTHKKDIKSPNPDHPEISPLEKDQSENGKLSYSSKTEIHLENLQDYLQDYLICTLKDGGICMKNFLFYG